MNVHHLGRHAWHGYHGVSVDDGTGVGGVMDDRTPWRWREGEQARQRVLNEAQSVLGEMVDYVGERLETHEMAFEVHLREGKYLQVLRDARQDGKWHGENEWL